MYTYIYIYYGSLHTVRGESNDLSTFTSLITPLSKNDEHEKINSWTVNQMKANDQVQPELAATNFLRLHQAWGRAVLSIGHTVKWKTDSERRKFSSQTFDNMYRWKSKGVKSPGGEDKKWEDQRRERERRKKMHVHEKGRKAAIHCVFFEWFVALTFGALWSWVSERFWKLSCGKSARRCGGKHISKSKVLKTHGLGPLLEVELW